MYRQDANHECVERASVRGGATTTTTTTTTAPAERDPGTLRHARIGGGALTTVTG